MPSFGGLVLSSGGTGNVVVNESLVTNATFQNLTNPDNDGKNYRVAKWLSNGSFVVTKQGFADILLCGAGGSGGNYEGVGVLGPGGAGGAILIVKKILFLEGTYTITIGQGIATRATQGQSTTLSGPFTSPISSFVAIGGSGGGNNANVGPSSMSVGSYPMTITETIYVGGQPAAGASGGAGGAGGNASGSTGGPGRTITGWSSTTLTLSAGGSSTYSVSSKTANTGDGGDGTASTFTQGASGIAFIRWQL